MEACRSAQPPSWPPQGELDSCILSRYLQELCEEDEKLEIAVEVASSRNIMKTQHTIAAVERQEDFEETMESFVEVNTKTTVSEVNWEAIEYLIRAVNNEDSDLKLLRAQKKRKLEYEEIKKALDEYEELDREERNLCIPKNIGISTGDGTTTRGRDIIRGKIIMTMRNRKIGMIGHRKIEI